ncbi:MAG: phage capsid protein [Clostridia bacterium]
MFDKIRDWIVRGLDKMFSKSTIEEALKVPVAISKEMDNAMELWLKIYTNNSPWLNKDVKSLELASSIAGEFARLTTLEMKTEITGSKRSDYLQEQYKKALKDLKSNLELGNAVGGMIFKPYVKNKDICIDIISQTYFKPLKFDNAGNIISAVFTSQIQKGKTIYTRLETHTLNNNVYTVENKVYKNDNYISSMLGKLVSLTDVEEWSDLSESVTIKGIEKPLFAYYKVPIANNIDTKCSLGISVFNRAINTIEDTETMNARLDYEYDSAERKLYVDSTAIKVDKDGKQVGKLPRIIQKIDLTNKENNFYEEFSPGIRDEAFLRGINKKLQQIEFQVGLAYGTISDPNNVDKTATEIKTSKQRSYSTVSQMQNNLQETLEHLVYILNVYTDLYELASSGEYETSFEWDDSIIVDSEYEQKIRQNEVNQKLRSKKSYLMWRYGLKEKQAEEMLKEVKSETEETEMFKEE